MMPSRKSVFRVSGAAGNADASFASDKDNAAALNKGIAHA
jgi:hypothetical protein